MQKEIILKGFTENPSDYECSDGELASAMGLVPEDSTMKPILPPKEMFVGLYEIHDLVYIHKGTGYKNYITKSNAQNDKNKLFRIEHTSASDSVNPHVRNGILYITIYDFDDNITIYSVKSVGNTLIVLTSEGMHYFLWKNGAYTHLGDHLPELPISFGLQGTREESTQFRVEYNATVPYDESITGAEYTEAVKDAVTPQVMAKVNSFIAKYYTNGSHFMYPFFVRYAYRLYDGSLTMHSAPIFMPCVSGQNPFVLARRWHKRDEEWDSSWDEQSLNECQVIGALFKLDFAVTQQKYINAIKEWRDIISSVDIFVSAPLYTIDQSGKCSGLHDLSFGSHYTVCKATHAPDPYNRYYQFHQMVNFMFYNKESLPGWSVDLPVKKSSVVNESISNTSNFYFLKSYDLDSLSTSRTQVQVEEGFFQSLLNRERLTDDYDSHDRNIPTKAFNYNSRLSISDMQKVLFRGYHVAAMIPFTDGFVQPVRRGGSSSAGWDGFDTDWSLDGTENVCMAIQIETDQGTKIVHSGDTNFVNGSFFASVDSETRIGRMTPINFLYYPNIKAVRAYIAYGQVNTIYDPIRMVQLSQHATLNGAYYFDWSHVPGSGISYVNMPNGPTNEENYTIQLPNKLYTSEVNNPFYFPVSGVVTIGVAKILGIMSAASPISPNEFGKFPLYAFTDEGVWALEVNKDGTFAPAQPATFDICIDADTITQTDKNVLFATSRGLMMMSGKDSICISDELTTNNAFDSSKLPNLDKVLQDYAQEKNLTYVPFLDYIKGCRMIYDYVHQRIIVFNPETENVNGQQVRKYSYAYVYSLKSKKWGMMYSTIAGTVNSYPNALAVTKEGETQTVVDYSEDGLEGHEETGLKGVIITRPIKLDEPDTLKTVNTVITRGKFEKGHVKTILYGSRDLENWHLIASSVDHTLRYLHGTPYKYFRIVLLCDLEKGESVISSTIEYTNKYADQIR